MPGRSDQEMNGDKHRQFNDTGGEEVTNSCGRKEFSASLLEPGRHPITRQPMPPANPEDNTLEGTVEVVYDFLVESGVARFDIQASRQAADRAPTSSLVIVVACCLRDPCSFCGNHLSSLCLAAPTSVCVTI